MSAALEPILGLLPAILLVVTLVCGRYPGEDLVARLARRPRSARRKAVSLGPTRIRKAAGIREPLLLLAASRPLRGPPLLSLSHP